MMSLVVVSAISLVKISDVFAAAINSDVALPVRKGGFVFRSQVRWLRADDGLNVVTIPNVLVYGATPDLSLFAMVPYIFRDEESTDSSSGERIDRNDNGIGDTTLLARYTFYAKDYQTGTTRFALLGGIKLPTGDDDLKPITTDSIDVPLGMVGTVSWGFRHEVDADLVYRVNTEANDFERGDDLVYDLSYQFRVYPWTLPEAGVPAFVYLVAEANGIFSQKNELNGTTIDDSGGHILFLSPGLQFLTRRFILEVSIQLPVIQDLKGNQPETDFALIGGFRVNLP